MRTSRLLAAASAIALIGGGAAQAQAPASWSPQVAQWGIEEVVLKSAHAYANPFTDVTLQAEFRCSGKTVKAPGFYDGEGTWKVRLMPQTPGACSFRTRSNDAALNGASGRFTVTPAPAGVHGMVRPAKTYHFSYADGTPYFLLGTTSYNWLNRDAALQDKTLATLRASPFTKIRFGLFPKWYAFNHVEPAVFPYVRKPDGSFDYDRFDPRFFANVDKRIQQLADMGVEADVILFHPYDHWGFSKMDQAHNEAWIRYVVARLAPYRNVWWTMANEYDLMTPRDWEPLGQAVRETDPYGHPVGIHNAGLWYDHSKPWIDHAIIQDGSPTAWRSAALARVRYGKPVVVDEFGYEGDNGQGWGDLSGAEEVSRLWDITMAGGYGSHGETYMHPGGVLWWAAGGELVGESPARLGFLKTVMTSLPFQDMAPAPELVVNGAALAKPGQAYLFRFKPVGDFGVMKQAQVRLAGADLFKVEAIDPWLMKVYPLGYTSAGDQSFPPPIAFGFLRITAARPGEGTPHPIAELTAAFTGNLPLVLPADPARFSAEPPVFSADYPISQMLGNPAARAALEQHFPKKALSTFATFMSPAQMAAHGRLSAQDLQALDAQLRKIPAR
jgi:hypothetical protein